MTEQTIVKSREKSKIKIDDKFGRLAIIENVGIRKGRTYFKCQCECGNIKIIAGGHLQNGHTKSCGCLKNERIGNLNKTHGMTGTIEYKSWQHMIERCTNQNNSDYHNYGARGICVCLAWLNSFENFYKDIGPKPKNFTIERIDNNGNYEPSNCIWPHV